MFSKAYFPWKGDQPVLKRSFKTLSLLVAMIALAGCSLLGVSPERTANTADIEQAIALLVEAGLHENTAAISSLLADEITIEFLPEYDNLPEALDRYNALSISEATTLLNDVWANTTLSDIDFNIAEIHVQGSTATVQGTFSFIPSEEDGLGLECTGAGALDLVRVGDDWVVRSVTVIDFSCEGDGPGDPGDTDPDPGVPGEPVPPDVPHFSFNTCEYMVLGIQSDQVKAVQEALAYLGYYSGRIDGDYGPMTERAVRAFQKDHGLWVDGETGPLTIEAIDRALREDGGYYVCGVAEDSPNAGPTMVTKRSLRTGTAFESPVYIYDSPNPGPTLAFVGCIHGNEKSGHYALMDAIDRGITISKGRVILVPQFNKIACDQNRRTLSRSGALLAGKDFNRMFPVGKRPTYLIAQELWDLLDSQSDLRFVIDFHDGFINSLGNTLLHTRQSRAGSVARALRDSLNQIRPSGARGPSWRAFTEPVSGSLIRKVGRDMGVPGILVELSGRNPGDPLSLRKDYAWMLIRRLAYEHDMAIAF